MIDLFRSRYVNVLNSLNIQLHPCSSFSGASNDQIMDRVIRLVKKFDKIDSSKVLCVCIRFSISVISTVSTCSNEIIINLLYHFFDLAS